MTLSLVYEISNGELIVLSKKGEKILWKGKPKGYDVIQVIPVESSDDCIVLLDWLKTGLENQKNFLRLDLHGNVVWEVSDPPEKVAPGPVRGKETETYTCITRIEEFQLVAYSYSGYSDHIDIETGVITKSEFVK